MSHRHQQFGTVARGRMVVVAILFGALVSCTLGCKGDRRDVERASVWLCERHLLEKPDEAMLVPGEQLQERLAAEDWSFLQGKKDAEADADDPFAAMGKAFEVALEPSVRAMALAMRSRTTCLVEIVSIEGDRAKVTVTQGLPDMENVGLGVLEVLGELASQDGQQQRVEAAQRWLDSIEGRIEEKHEIDLVKEAGTWRIKYGLAARARAEERGLLTARLDELRAHREKLEAEKTEREQARQALSRFEVKQARFYRRNTGFMTEPVIDLTVHNGTEHAISRAHFKGVVASPERSVPWIEESFNHRIRGGLEPGEEARWRLNPNMFSAWGTRVPPEAELKVEVVRIDGPDGEALYSIEEREDPWDPWSESSDLPQSLEGVDAEISGIQEAITKLTE